MFVQASSNPMATAFLPGLFLDVSAESLISAYSYKNIADSQLGTAGGLSWAFGENRCTLTFVPSNDISFFQVSRKNLEAISLLEQWFAQPDNLGEKFWEEFDKELETNKFSIP